MSRFVELDPVRSIELSGEDAALRLRCSRSSVLLYAAPQRWPTTACGFHENGLPHETVAYVVVAVCSSGGKALVYHGGRFAYELDHLQKWVLDKLASGMVPGVHGSPIPVQRA